MFFPIHQSKLFSYLGCAVLAFILSSVFTLVLVKILPRFGILDKPNERKIHKHPIPRMGGPAICFAFVIPMIVLGYYDNTQKGIIIGGGVALLVGILDDIYGVKATVKLLVLFLLTLLLRKYGLATNLPFYKLGLPNEITNILVSLFWIVGVTSAINALDHMDGLASSVSLIACLSYLAVSLQTGDYFWGLVSISLAGSLLGFLCFNWNPAKIFMGDSGSFFLGFTLSSIGVMGGWSENSLKSAFIPILILSLPIFDLIYVIISRYWNGTTKTIVEAIIYCGKDHIGHRLMKLGLKQKMTAIVVCVFCSAISISSLTIRNASNFEVFLLVLQILLMYFALVLLMNGFDLKGKRANLKTKNNSHKNEINSRNE